MVSFHCTWISQNDQSNPNFFVESNKLLPDIIQEKRGKYGGLKG
jgi:hypothetical protein